MKIYQAVRKLLVGERQTHRQNGDLISLLSFLESRLKTCYKIHARTVLFTANGSQAVFSGTGCATLSVRFSFRSMLLLCSSDVHRNTSFLTFKEENDLWNTIGQMSGRENYYFKGNGFTQSDLLKQRFADLKTTF
jgi:hypothetical protein